MEHAAERPVGRPRRQRASVLMRDWLQRLDARIDRCAGCDQWRWDRECSRCDNKATWQGFDQWLTNRETKEQAA